MEPLRIELKNFTCYGHEVFDFTPVTMAALCGPNGSGKSSLIDAMLWALFGQTPRGNARNIDNIVRKGTDLAEVVFDFRLGGQVYRVRRVRDARRGRSSVELFAVHVAPVAWHPAVRQRLRSRRLRVAGGAAALRRLARPRRHGVGR